MANQYNQSKSTVIYLHNYSYFRYFNLYQEIYSMFLFIFALGTGAMICTAVYVITVSGNCFLGVSNGLKEIIVKYIYYPPPSKTADT